MRIARLRIHKFRGFDNAEFVLSGHTVFSGEPRAGRSDLVEALRRVLDPRSTRNRVNPLDIHRSAITPGASERTEVEVVLLDLGSALEALLDDVLEAFDPSTGEQATGSTAGRAALGVRLCYRATYDFDSDSGDHWVDFPKQSLPDIRFYKKVSRVLREALPVLFVDHAEALQLRAEGALRSLLAQSDQAALDSALAGLDVGVRLATQSFSRSGVVDSGLQVIASSGPGDLFGLSAGKQIEFVADDGSLATLLRALQPAISLDSADPLPARSHGSTLISVLSAAEAVAAARARADSLTIIGDDFGDAMDASSAEHMAGLLRSTAHQCLLTTRRPEVLRAFDAEELVRFSIRAGAREAHRLPVLTSKSDRIARRLVLDQLLAAITARTVTLVEGPLDVEGYGTLARRLEQSNGAAYSFSASGIRLVSPPGSDGGISRLPEMARVAVALGFKVKAIVDNDKPGAEDPAVAQLESIVEQLVVLPDRTAVEAALIRGVTGVHLRAIVADLASSGLEQLPGPIADDEIADHVIRTKALKKSGLHSAFATLLAEAPPIASAVIAAVCSAHTGRIDIPAS